MQELTKTDNPAPTTKKPKKLNPKQRKTGEYYFDENSETFANLYKSALKAGFSNTYSLNLANRKPQWLSEMVDMADFAPEHIKQGIQNLSRSAPDSRSPDDTRLKAYELLAKITGIMDNKNSTVNVNIVQPILAGQSTPAPVRVEVDQA